MEGAGGRYRCGVAQPKRRPTEMPIGLMIWHRQRPRLPCHQCCRPLYRPHSTHHQVESGNRPIVRVTGWRSRLRGGHTASTALQLVHISSPAHDDHCFGGHTLCLGVDNPSTRIAELVSSRLRLPTTDDRPRSSTDAYRSTQPSRSAFHRGRRCPSPSNALRHSVFADRTSRSAASSLLGRASR